MRELNDYVGGYAGDFTGEAWQDDGAIELDIDEPAPEPAYDVDASDAEWHDKPVTSMAMALDVLRSGRALMTQCGPLQVTAEQTGLVIWNTETCYEMVREFSTIERLSDALHVFGHVADGAWRVYCPDEPDGAPLY